MVAATKATVTSFVQRLERPVYWMTMMFRAVVVPKSVVSTTTATLHWLALATFGIVVVKDALPVADVVIVDDVITGESSAATVNVTLAPASARPSGSVTVTKSVTGFGSFDRLTW